MNFSKHALMGAVTALAYSLCPLFADTDAATNLTDEQELEALRDYIESKRDITIKPKGGQLRIGGDVRVEYKRMHQVLDGERVEGRGRGGDRRPNEPNIPANVADIEASLSFDYSNDKSFSELLFKFSNRAGLDTTNYSDSTKPSADSSRISYKGAFQPSNNKIALAKAVVGRELWTKDSHKIVGNLGRQRLYDLLESRVMFFSRFDGIALKYTGALEGIGHTHLTWGGFMVADRVSHYAHAVEAGLSQILDTGLNVKYAYIDWSRSGKLSDGSSGSSETDQNNNMITNPIYLYLNKLTNYAVSQASVSYEIPQDLVAGRKLKVYGAYAHNHKARGMKDAYAGNNKDHKHSDAWYAGLTLGRIRMPGDYVFDICYQYVEPQSVPEIDSFGGAGRGNLTGVWGVADPSQGFTNYKGVRAQFTYAATPDMLVNLKAHATRAAINKLDSSSYPLATRLRSSRNSWEYLEIEVVYSF